jgi:hypothetical protein
LQEILAGLCRFRATPLQSDFDAREVVTAALPDRPITVRLLVRLVQEALSTEDARCPAPTAVDPCNGSAPEVLAGWLEHLDAVLRAAHPLGVEILARRVAGDTDRDIARQLGLGLRLVRQIRADARLAWEKAAIEE